MGNPFAGVFDHVYCVNLPSRADRREAAFGELSRIGAAAAVEFVPGVWIEDGQATGVRRREGCKAAHANVMRDAIKRGFSSILVLEDDVIFRGDFEKLWPARKRFLLEVGVDWKVFALGGVIRGASADVGGAALRVDGFLLTHAYALRTPKPINTFLRELEKKDERPIDYVLHDVAKGFMTYCSNPFLAWQRSGYSDIRGRDFDWVERAPAEAGMKGFYESRGEA